MCRSITPDGGGLLRQWAGVGPAAPALVNILNTSQHVAGHILHIHIHVLLSAAVALLTVLLIEKHDRYYMAITARATFAREPPFKKRRRARPRRRSRPLAILVARAAAPAVATIEVAALEVSALEIAKARRGWSAGRRGVPRRVSPPATTTRRRPIFSPSPAHSPLPPQAHSSSQQRPAEGKPPGPLRWAPHV